MTRLLIVLTMILTGITNVIPCSIASQSYAFLPSLCNQDMTVGNAAEISASEKFAAINTESQEQDDPCKGENSHSCATCAHGCCQLVAVMNPFKLLSYFSSVVHAADAPEMHLGVSLDLPKEPPRLV